MSIDFVLTLLIGIVASVFAIIAICCGDEKKEDSYEDK